MNDQPIYGPSPLLEFIKEFERQKQIIRLINQNLFNKKMADLENEKIYLETKKNYKDNGIYEDNETNDD